MRKLSTIQKNHKLNSIFRDGEPGPGSAYHDYTIALDNSALTGDTPDQEIHIAFQKGARLNPGARHGVLDVDLLEIVRDRLTAFQAGDFACRANAIALTHIEEALMWMNKRVEDRAENGTLGTYKF